MSTERLDLSNLRKAIFRLAESLARDMGDEVVRDGAIKRFEYTYELSWKFIRKHFLWAGVEDLEEMTRKDLFREAARRDLITDPEQWFDYMDARNLTSHVYDGSTAEEVHAIAGRFLLEARHLLDQLASYHDHA